MVPSHGGETSVDSAAVAEPWFDELSELLAIPSVSADPERAGDVARAADWLAGFIRDAGGSAEVVPTDTQPLILGDLAASNGSAPTVLVYGHVDVQPPDPLELWESDPYTLEQRGEWLFGRGVVDDKGQLYMLAKAAAELSAAGELPVNVRFACDSEEETGGHQIVDFLAADERGADAALIFDSGMTTRGVPEFAVATRGLVYFHLTVRTGGHDLHSGLFGGAALTPSYFPIGEHPVDHRPVGDGQRSPSAFADRAQNQKVANRSWHAQAVGNRRRAFPRLRLLGALLERADDRRAVLGLDRHHPRPAAGADPANPLDFLEGFPHADHAGAAAGRIDDPVRPLPVHLLGELVGHRLLAFDAIRLFQRRHVIPAERPAFFRRHPAGIGDQPVDQRDVRAVEAAFVDERPLRVLRDEDFAGESGSGRVGGGGVAGIAGGRQRDGRGAQVLARA